jgi:nucleoside-diphosphate-sugar epimerase
MTRRTGLTTIVFRPPWVGNFERAKREGWLEHMQARRDGRRDTTLWAYIDARDIARAYRLALESALTGHHVFYPMANDLGTTLSPTELLEKHYPTLLPFVDKLQGNTFYDIHTIREQIGFEAQITLKQVLEEK